MMSKNFARYLYSTKQCWIINIIIVYIKCMFSVVGVWDSSYVTFPRHIQYYFEFISLFEVIICLYAFVCSGFLFFAVLM